MSISSFEDLLAAARQQTEPQRLLFVFAGTELAEDATPGQRAAYLAGQGGALVPLMSLDRTPQEIGSFSALETESRDFGPDWVIVFVAALSGRDGIAPSSVDVTGALNGMADAIKAGRLSAFIPFDRQGQTVVFR